MIQQTFGEADQRVMLKYHKTYDYVKDNIVLSIARIWYGVLAVCETE